VPRRTTDEELRGLVGTRIALATDYTLVFAGSEKFVTIRADELSDAIAWNGDAYPGILIRPFPVTSRQDNPVTKCWISIACLPKPLNVRALVVALGGIVPSELTIAHDVLFLTEDGKETLENMARGVIHWIVEGDTA
jgi:hypothetical protein